MCGEEGGGRRKGVGGVVFSVPALIKTFLENGMQEHCSSRSEGK